MSNQIAANSAINHELADLAAQLLDHAKRAGAKEAEVVFGEMEALTVGLRLGKLEKLERAETREVGLRVFLPPSNASKTDQGWSVASVSTSRLAPQDLPQLASQAVEMAKAAPPDAYAGLAEPHQLAKNWPELDLYDPTEPDVAQLQAQVAAMEGAALAVKGVVNSEGAAAEWQRSSRFFVTSNGFVGGYRASNSMLSITAIAKDQNGEMEQDYDYALTRFRQDLPAPELLGSTAGQLAVKRLHPKKLSTATMPVVFAPRVARGLVGHILAAISGAAITRRASFLLDHLGKSIASNQITLVEDPHRPRGLRSRPFDAEGIASIGRNLVEGGVLQHYLLDLASARQLNMTPTGHAVRAMAGTPHPSVSNVWLAPGSLSVPELIGDITYGLYVTDLMGMGVNLVTGDYSQGANGYLIVNGQIAEAVSEVTIASKLQEMLAELTPANDLVLRYGIDAPTLRINRMTIAGK
jgi:PmbA protein